MTTLTIRIDDKSKLKYKLNEKIISFEELRQRIIGEEGLNALTDANRIAKKRGLRKLSKIEVEKEIQDTRRAQTRS